MLKDIHLCVYFNLNCGCVIVFVQLTKSIWFLKKINISPLTLANTRNVRHTLRKKVLETFLLFEILI